MKSIATVGGRLSPNHSRIEPLNRRAAFTPLRCTVVKLGCGRSAGFPALGIPATFCSFAKRSLRWPFRSPAPERRTGYHLSTERSVVFGPRPVPGRSALDSGSSSKGSPYAAGFPMCCAPGRRAGWQALPQLVSIITSLPVRASLSGCGPAARPACRLANC